MTDFRMVGLVSTLFAYRRLSQKHRFLTKDTKFTKTSISKPKHHPV